MVDDRKTCILWIPESRALSREPEDPQPDGIPAPEAPIGVDLIDEHANADAQVLWRALKLNGLHRQALVPTRFVSRLPGYQHLMNFRLEYETNGKKHDLPRPLPKERLPGEPRTSRIWKVDTINVVATLEPAATPGTTEELTLGVDTAFVDANSDEPTSRPVLVSRQLPEIGVDDLARLMCQGFLNPWSDAEEDSADTQYTAFLADCHETAANLLRPRAEALQLIAERQVHAALENRLQNGEHVTIEVHHDEDRLTVTARASLEKAQAGSGLRHH